MEAKRLLSKAGLGVASVAILAVITVVLFLSPVVEAISGTSEPVSLVPQLTAEQETTAVQVAVGDKVVGPLLEARAWNVAHIGPWTAPDQRLLGVAMEIEWPDPMSLDGSWPIYIFDASGDQTSKSVLAQVRAENVTGVRVMVTLDPEAVVEVIPVGATNEDSVVLPSPYASTAAEEGSK